jgi:hypothetical protein
LILLRTLGLIDDEHIDGARVGSRFSPSCSCSAVKIEGLLSSIGCGPGGAAGGD